MMMTNLPPEMPTLELDEQTLKALEVLPFSGVSAPPSPQSMPTHHAVEDGLDKNDFSILERVPPQSLEAEQALLGGVLIDPDALTRVVDTVRSEHFYRPSHRLLYETISKLFEKGEPIDSPSNKHNYFRAMFQIGFSEPAEIVKEFINIKEENSTYSKDFSFYLKPYYLNL